MRLRGLPHAPAGLFSLALTFLLAISVLPGGAVAKKSKPDISKNVFENRVTEPFYFEDSDNLLILEQTARIVYRSEDAGKTWEPIEDDTKGRVHALVRHPYDNKKAYALSSAHQHWYTNDQGKTWKEFKTAAVPSPWRQPLSFHAGDSNKIIFQAQACQGLFDCDEVSLYTTDGFETEAKLLRSGTRGCDFACSSDLFTTGSEELDKSRILCITRGRFSPYRRDFTLLVSDDYFEHEAEPNLIPGRTVKGLVNMAVVKRYIVVAVKAEATDEMALYVTVDTMTWHRAEFSSDHRVEEDAYTLLESTAYSMQLDVQNTRPSVGMGILFTSNSNGTYFQPNIEHTNRDISGLIDFEKVAGVQGIVMVNTVKNWKDVERTNSFDKELVTQISFDDGRTFHNLKAGKKDLHLHSVTNLHNIGRVFSSPAPGIMMGVGNTGDHIKAYDKGDLYVSDDAGLTWTKALDDAHKYEFGDQGSVLLAINDEGPTDKILYSINHGKDWEQADLGEKIIPLYLTTTPDSTSLKFTLVAYKEDKKSTGDFVFAIDFEGLHERKCGDKDFEIWHARVDDKGEPACIMGQKQSYRRRKADADCFIDEDFKDPEPKFEPCTCTDADYECDYNFVLSDGECKPAGSQVVPDGECKNRDDKFMGSSGYQLIAGNGCSKKGGVEKDKPVERPCSDVWISPASGKIFAKVNEFDLERFEGYFYLERTASSRDDDETVILRADNRDGRAGKVFKSHDHGKSWESILDDEKVVAIYPHSYFNDVVFFITDSKTVYYSLDRAKRIHKFKAPLEPNTQFLPILSFHPTEKDWLIWTGNDGCDGKGNDCHATAYVSEDRGESWKVLLRYVRKCEFVTEPSKGTPEVPESKEAREKRKKLVYCEQYEDEDPKKPLELFGSDNFFEESSKPFFKDIVDFATMSEFIIVAAKDSEKKSLKVEASVDGNTFANALFPPNFEVPHQSAYTVLDSSTHSVFLHVTTNALEDYEYGSIIKSNSNGTSYVMSLEAVNRNAMGYVDFEKMQGLEGVAIVNKVHNPEEAKAGKEKKLKTMVTHNDGGEWDYIKPPSEDADGKGWGCSGSLDSCSLNLHGYTERKDPRDTYSSPSAVGLMMGVGNVGEVLGPYKEGDTFVTSDGGINWNAVKKGHFLWEYGDQGSIIVIVEESTGDKPSPTNVIFFSRDEGKSWEEFRFSDQLMFVEEITTVPSDVSRNFLLWARLEKDPEHLVTVNLDFSGLTDRQCELNEESPTEGDYYLWEPKHPAQKENCLFGHVAQYHRKRAESECFNGPEIERLHSIAHNCECTRQDFECDYNFQAQNDRSCGLVPGLDPSDHSKICKEDPNAVEYFEPTGYRRIPLTTCEGGTELEYRKAQPCPDHEEEFRKEHRGLSGFTFFLAVVLPFVAAAGVGYWVWRNWDGKFGRIRLGEQGGIGTFDAESPWIKYPVTAVAVIVAVVIAIPDTLGRLWRSVTGRFGSGGERRYTTRSSFARGRGDYAVVDEDEGELLGDDSDEEV
ncbi:MAG: vacuolar protein sorting/targeting protein PEP1 [Chaenotheca gracillima]|nr:MAG: vacuolar protein sorting/targeting protein PEP1 [Chaenotheca gracillima]